MLCFFDIMYNKNVLSKDRERGGKLKKINSLKNSFLYKKLIRKVFKEV